MFFDNRRRGPKSCNFCVMKLMNAVSDDPIGPAPITGVHFATQHLKFVTTHKKHEITLFKIKLHLSIAVRLRNLDNDFNRRKSN